MSNEKEWFVDKNFKDNNFLTFNSGNTEFSYKYKNIKVFLKERLQNLINTHLSNNMSKIALIPEQNWTEGIGCELLQDGLERKGKLRLKVTLEFVPDEVEVIQGVEGITDGRSPLDDIRQINL
jgi:hypothetical protein